MKLKIDQAGRVVIPKGVRGRLGGGGVVEAVNVPEGVLLKAAVEEPAMRRRNGLWVHRGAAPAGLDWNKVVESAREARIAEEIG